MGDASAVELSGYFEDPDGDALAYEASTSDAGVARASVAGSVVTVEGVGEGDRDGDGGGERPQRPLGRAEFRGQGRVHPDGARGSLPLDKRPELVP